jgi:hypothetical protein
MTASPGRGRLSLLLGRGRGSLRDRRFFERGCSCRKAGRGQGLVGDERLRDMRTERAHVFLARLDVAAARAMELITRRVAITGQAGCGNGEELLCPIASGDIEVRAVDWLTFSDAVVAIAITLLAIDLPVPTGDTVPEFWASVRHNGGHYAAFLISFSAIAAAWSHHHDIFQYARRMDSRLKTLNTAWLFMIILNPFAAKPLASQGKGLSITVPRRISPSRWSARPAPGSRRRTPRQRRRCACGSTCRSLHEVVGTGITRRPQRSPHRCRWPRWRSCRRCRCRT